MRDPYSLKGFRILVTREQSQAKALSREIVVHGGIPIEVPLLQIQCVHYDSDRPIWNRLSTYKWLFFTSANGVHCFFEQLKRLSFTKTLIQKMNIAVVGHKTEDALKEYGFKAQFMPTIYDATTMAKEFFTENRDTGGPYLLIQGNQSLELLPKVFQERNIPFDTMITYETSPYLTMKDKLTYVLQNESIDIITFTSPSVVDVFVQLGGLANVPFDQAVACIGTTTEKRAKEVGFINTITPKQFTIESMVESISYFTKDNQL